MPEPAATPLGCALATGWPRAMCCGWEAAAALIACGWASRAVERSGSLTAESAPFCCGAAAGS